MLGAKTLLLQEWLRVVEAQQRLPNAEACGTHRSGGTEADNGRKSV